jgi:hypothetical protein
MKAATITSFVENGELVFEVVEPTREMTLDELNKDRNLTARFENLQRTKEFLKRSVEIDKERLSYKFMG